VDNLGNVYVVGAIRNQVDLDPDPTMLIHNAMDTDLVIMKIDGGGAFAWSKVIGGSGFQVGKGVATTQLGDVYLTGQFSGSADFDPGTGTDIRSSTGETDIFLTKINASGSYAWTYTLGSGAVTSEQGLNLVPDKFNNIYVVGSYQGTVNFDPGTNVFSQITRGGHDAFLIRFDADGQFRWVQTFGGAMDDFANGVAIDSSGKLFVAGTFRDTVDFDPSASTNMLASAGGSDGYLSHFALRSDMSVLGNGQTIANNDISPRIADGTDFGDVQIARGEGARTNHFTIQSTGEKELVLDGNPLISLVDIGRFSVVAQPGASINPGQTGIVSVRFDPTNSGYFKTTVSVSSDDPDANPYRFDIQGYSDTELQITHLTHSITNAVMTWSAVSNRTFSIWKGTNLLQGFPIRVFGNLLSTPPMNTMNIPLSSNEPSAYFRIQVD